MFSGCLVHQDRKDIAKQTSYIVADRKKRDGKQGVVSRNTVKLACLQHLLSPIASPPTFEVPLNNIY